jgi:hypothetical protein
VDLFVHAEGVLIEDASVIKAVFLGQEYPVMREGLEL